MCSASPTSICKSYCPTGWQCIGGRGVGGCGVNLWTDDHHLIPPYPWLPASEISKLPFLPTWPAYWLLSGVWPDSTPSFGNRFWLPAWGWLLLAPLLSWPLILLGFPGENYDQDNIWACCLWLASPSRAFGGCSQQLPKPFVLRILPISPLLITGCNLCSSLVEWKLAFGTSRQAPKLGKSTSVHMGNPPICEYQGYLGILASGFWCVSDVENSLGHEVLFGHLWHLVLMCVWC